MGCAPLAYKGKGVFVIVLIISTNLLLNLRLNHNTYTYYTCECAAAWSMCVCLLWLFFTKTSSYLFSIMICLDKYGLENRICHILHEHQHLILICFRRLCTCLSCESDWKPSFLGLIKSGLYQNVESQMLTQGISYYTS